MLSNNFMSLRSAARIASLAALLGGTCLAAPVIAQTAPQPAMPSADMPQETVDQRIDTLHASLQITPNEEADWTRVAQTMRDNDGAMQKLVAERKALDPSGITAVDDLKWYERSAKAHVKGLRRLIELFGTLYETMPGQQKGVADHVFRTFGRQETRASN